MKVLFIGGTGNISLAVTQLAAARGIEVTLVRRGQRAAEMPEGVSTIVADIVDEATVAAALGDRHFDAVVDWIAFTPDQIERDIRLFRGRCNQFVFISSASCLLYTSFPGIVQVRFTASPVRLAERSLTGSGRLSDGGKGAPGVPQPTRALNATSAATAMAHRFILSLIHI